MKIVLILLTFILLSCNQNETKQKELKLKERELALREKELAYKENDTMQSIKAQRKKLISTATPNENIGSKEYYFDQHNDIKVFITDLAKAVSANDRDIVAKMITFPLNDEWSETIPLGCKNEEQFMTKYDLIFTGYIKDAIISNKYRAADNSDEMFPDVIKKGEYLIAPDNPGGEKRPDIMLGLRKINGKFKIYAIKFYS